MALHALVFPAVLKEQNFLILHDIKNEFTILLPELLAIPHIAVKTRELELARIIQDLNSILLADYSKGCNFTSYALQIIELRLSFTIVLLTKVNESQHVLLNLRLLELLNRIKHLYDRCYEDFLDS